MRKTRFFIMIFVLVGIMFVLSGCGLHYSDHFDFDFSGRYMADKYVDLLIPIDEDDEFYTPYNCNIEGHIEIPEDSEIVNYNKDGYRSMLMYVKDSRLEIYIQDSEGHHNTHEEYNGIPYKISQCVCLPSYHMSERDEKFKEFCNKYKKCYAVVFDGNGNILHISKQIPIVSLGKFYLQDISYNLERNRIKPDYVVSEGLSYSVLEVWLLSVVGTIGCIITLIVGKLNQNRPIVSYKGYEYIIASAIFNIPVVVLIMTFLYMAFGTSFTIVDFFINLFNIFIGYLSFIFMPINIGVLIHFIRLIQLEKENASEKNLDISGKI
ncbi:MAG: hypothetical protein K2H28_05360 [Ruminococcus sp.]|nr:hypothetical protein [Ruminococcus sp.]